MTELTFQGYIKAVGLMELNIIIRDNSDIKVSKALDIVRDRTNENAEKYDDVDVKAKLVDMRTGNIYQVYSDLMMDKYEIIDWYNVELNNEEIQRFLNSLTEVNYKDLLEALKNDDGFLQLIQEKPIKVDYDELAIKLADDSEFAKVVEVKSIQTLLTNLEVSIPQNMLKCDFVSNNLSATFERNSLGIILVESEK